MDTRRLKLVRDICPLSPGHHHWLYASAWMRAVARNVTMNENGYCLTVISNKFITWQRTFTRDAHEPACESLGSLITVHEWAPTIFPAHRSASWKKFGIHHREAIVFLNENFSWSSHARRHLTQFKKNPNITLRLGSFEDFEKNISASQVPPRLQKVFITEVRRHLAVHPETIEFLIAENSTDVLACFVVGNLIDIRQSYYIAGFFKRGTEKLHAKTGLIDWWFERSREKKFATLNFGHIVGPCWFERIESGAGYSNFKTHFGARRIWWPGSFWKIKWRTPLLVRAEKPISQTETHIAASGSATIS